MDLVLYPIGRFPQARKVEIPLIGIDPRFWEPRKKGRIKGLFKGAS
jgi:hypothetical protein